MKLLLVEDDVNTCEIFKKIERAKSEIKFIAITNSEVEALNCVKNNMPDGIILDLELTNGKGSGFGFLKELRKIKLKILPKIIVTTNICTDSVYDYLHDNKVDFIFYKKQEGYSEENVIDTLLLLNGYTDNISYTENTKHNESNESKISIIQYLGGKYKRSTSTISRAMQNAILYAWRISAIEDLTTYYTAKINYETGVPTPTEFIYYYANKIKKKMI